MRVVNFPPELVSNYTNGAFIFIIMETNFKKFLEENVDVVYMESLDNPFYNVFDLAHKLNIDYEMVLAEMQESFFCNKTLIEGTYYKDDNTEGMQVFFVMDIVIPCWIIATKLRNKIIDEFKVDVMAAIQYGYLFQETEV